jgi:hypothetical protein
MFRTTPSGKIQPGIVHNQHIDPQQQKNTGQRALFSRHRSLSDDIQGSVCTVFDPLLMMAESDVCGSMFIAPVRGITSESTGSL